MPRNISFAHTTPQFLARAKTVTRRNGWRFLTPGDVLMACRKIRGLRKGEQLERLGLILDATHLNEPSGISLLMSSDTRSPAFMG